MPCSFVQQCTHISFCSLSYYYYFFSLKCYFFFFFPGRDQYYRRLFLWVCCSGSTRRLNREFNCCFWRSLGSNLRPLVYKASNLTTAPRRLIFFFFFFFFFPGRDQYYMRLYLLRLSGITIFFFYNIRCKVLCVGLSIIQNNYYFQKV